MPQQSRNFGWRRGGTWFDRGYAHPRPRVAHDPSPLGKARTSSGGPDVLAVLKAAHGLIGDEVRPVYALEERTATSRVLVRGFGSCSQRMAILESVARAAGVPTRIRALLIDRSFWYRRFPRIRCFLPTPVVLAWPEFKVGGWLSVSELFGSVGCRGGARFTNAGSETLFEAVGRCVVDWDGISGDSAHNLSRFVVADLGFFTHRDDLFVQVGQTLCGPARFFADPLLRRISA